MTTKDPLQKPATRHRLWMLFDSDILPLDAWKRAQELTKRTPTGDDWIRFMDRLLLILGTILLLAGIFFFFAFNWVDLPRFTHFAIVQGAVVVATLLAFWLKLETWGGRVSLLAASLLVGVTLAVVGQEYQTGADSWRLFFIWMLLITGWTLISQWNAVYVAWMVLVNVSISTYWWQVIGTDFGGLSLTMMGVNFVFILAWDTALRIFNFAFLHDRWHQYIFALPLFAYATFHMIDFIFDFEFSEIVEIAYPPLLFFGTLGIFTAFYTLFRRDLPMLTMAALSVLVVLVAWIGLELWNLFDIEDDLYFDPLAYFCVMGFVTIGLTAAFAYALRRLQLAWEID